MDTIHRGLAYVAVVGVGAGVAWSLVLAVSGRTGGETFVRLQAAVASLLLVTAASGLIVLAAGMKPADGIHLLYALVAVALVPLLRTFLGRASGRGASILSLVAFGVLSALLYRLFATG